MTFAGKLIIASSIRDPRARRIYWNASDNPSQETSSRVTQYFLRKHQAFTTLTEPKRQKAIGKLGTEVVAPALKALHSSEGQVKYPGHGWAHGYSAPFLKIGKVALKAAAIGLITAMLVGSTVLGYATAISLGITIGAYGLAGGYASADKITFGIAKTFSMVKHFNKSSRVVLNGLTNGINEKIDRLLVEA